jgi:hypothetical protein
VDAEKQMLPSTRGSGSAGQPPEGWPFSGPGGMEGAVMRAFSAALGLGGAAIEPTTDFWSAGGDSFAAALVRGFLQYCLELTLVFLHAFPAYMSTRCVCRQAAVQGLPQVLPLVGLARSKQGPMKRGHGAQYLYRPPPSGAENI